MKQGFSDKSALRPQNSDNEKERLLKIIGQKAVILDFQKKIAENLSL